MTLLTVGHGTASQDELTALLRDAGVRLLVDVRTAPGSRRHPHVARAELERWLPEAGIAYRWERDLGGFRKPAPDSPDVVWREPMFRRLADEGGAERVRHDQAGVRGENLARHLLCGGEGQPVAMGAIIHPLLVGAKIRNRGLDLDDPDFTLAVERDQIGAPA